MYRTAYTYTVGGLSGLGSGGGSSYTGFATTWNTENAGTSANDQITLPLTISGSYNFTVRYKGDIIKTVTNKADNIVTFPDGPGIKTIEIENYLTGWSFGNVGGDKLKLIEIHNWGELDLGTASAFTWDGCSNLTTISATDELALTGTTNFLNFFRNCSSLTFIPILNTSGITQFSQAFNGCSSLLEVPLWDYSTGGCTNFASTWANCSSLTSFPSSFDFSAVTSVSGAWSGCSGLTSFPLYTFAPGADVNFRLAWRTCSNLSTFPLIDFSNSTDLYFTFEGTNLTSIPLFDLSSMTNGTGMLQGTTINTPDYNALLVATEANNQNGAHQWSMGSAKYSGAGGVARAALIADHSWTILDGGAA